MRLAMGLTILALAGCQLGQAGNASASSDVACRHADGMIDGPYVDDEATARAIALAIIRRAQDAETQAKYDLDVNDEGAYWGVFQSPKNYPRQEGEAVVIKAGGGGLSMDIAKCDGAISSVHWQK